MSRRAEVGPMPGTETSSSSAARQAGLLRTASSRSASILASSLCSQTRWASTRRTSLASRSWRRRWLSLPVEAPLPLSTICRRRATSSPRWRRLVRQRPRLRLHRLGEVRDRLGVQPVGLGQPTSGAGEVADLAWFDDHQRQARSAQRRGHGRLEAAGRLEHDQARDELGQAFGQRRQTGGIPANGKGLPSRPHVHVQLGFGDVNTDECRI